MVIFHTPTDVPVFENRWSEEFVPRAEHMPGLRRVVLSRVMGGPAGGGDVHLVHEFLFDDADAVKAAMVSPEGQAAGRALMGFAAPYVTLCFAEHMEEARPLAVPGTSA
jgi:uncharacterized protein (TIGR02118 family)